VDLYDFALQTVEGREALKTVADMQAVPEDRVIADRRGLVAVARAFSADGTTCAALLVSRTSANELVSDIAIGRRAGTSWEILGVGGGGWPDAFTEPMEVARVSATEEEHGRVQPRVAIAGVSQSRRATLLYEGEEIPSSIEAAEGIFLVCGAVDDPGRATISFDSG
jgi:hypothetical protein